MPETWVEMIRAIHDRAFNEIDWDRHLDELNSRLALDENSRFATPAPGLSPIWFVGNVEALEPGRWLLVLSLNPAYRPDDGWHTAQRYTAETYWDHWRLMYARYPEVRFNGPFAEIASALYGEEVGDAAAFAASRLVFVELCPYASASFNHDPSVLDHLSQNDIGIQRAAQIRDILIEEAQPSVILVNGREAIRPFEARYHGALAWHRVTYPSLVRPQRSLWHMEGVLNGRGSHLVAGFPFLRKPQTHNAYADVRQIGASLRVLGERAGLLPASE